MKNQRVALIILDGWGIGEKNPDINAIEKARTPFMDALFESFPHSRIETSGKSVGLPEGQMGNSEVGHLNIGAGRIVYQPLVLINEAFENGSAAKNKTLLDAFSYAAKEDKKVHLTGLLSDGGVHSSAGHLHGLCSIAAEAGIKNVFVHAITDGRDTNTHDGIRHIAELQQHLQKTTGKIASITGRYYAMDRDKRWERTQKAYEALVHGRGKPFTDPEKAVQSAYDEGLTDEFIEPIVIQSSNGEPLANIAEGDVVICFNFRTDRARQLTEALTQHDMPEFGMKTLPIRYVTMTEYDSTYQNVEVLFSVNPGKMTLGETLEKAGRTQLRMAETEKYPHVTYFFSGGREKPFRGETRLMVPSPKVATYDLQPEMSAAELTQKARAEIEKQLHDFIVINYANPDMVGHTGVFDAVVKAVETTDKCCRQGVEKALENQYICIVTADHGNAEYMFNPDGTPNTAHTLNPVPLFILYPDNRKADLQVSGKLANIAPTIVKLMGMDIPDEMKDQESLLR